MSHLSLQLSLYPPLRASSYSLPGRAPFMLHLLCVMALFLTVSSASIFAALAAKTDSLDEQKIAGLEKFITKAMTLNMIEIEAGKLAQQKSRSGDVQTFAQRMVRHHTAVNQRLVGLVRDKDIPLPDQNSLMEKTRPALKELRASQNFDIDYANNQITSHEETIQFLNQGKLLDDDDIKLWTEETLKKIYDHLELAKVLRDQVSPEKVDSEQ